MEEKAVTSAFSALKAGIMSRQEKKRFLRKRALEFVSMRKDTGKLSRQDRKKVARDVAGRLNASI